MSVPYFLDFWGVVIMFNGVLFGLLSVLAILGATAIRYWEGDPVRAPRAAPRRDLLGIAALVGLVMFVAGRAMKGHEHRV